MRRITIFFGLWLLSGTISAPWAMPEGTQNRPKTPDIVAEKPRLGQAGSQQELDAYNRLHNEIDPIEKKKLIDQFGADYPDSGLLAYVHQDGVYLGRQSNNLELVAEYGEKSLQLWPDNYTLLTELGSVFVQRNRIDQAEAMAAKALDLIQSSEKPVYLTDAQWAEGKKMLMMSNCNTLGYVHLRRAHANPVPAFRKSDATNAISWFERAQSYHPSDDFALYGLGFCYVLLNDYANAESNLAKAVAVDGIVMASARTLLEEIYKSQHNQSLNGLEQVIAKAKAEIGMEESRGRDE